MSANTEQRVSYLRLEALRIYLFAFILAVVVAPAYATSMHFQAHQPQGGEVELWTDGGQAADTIVGHQCLSHVFCSLNAMLPAGPAVSLRQGAILGPPTVRSPSDQCGGGLFHPPRPIA